MAEDNNKQCAFCGATPEKISRCAGCNSVFYCNREHQTAHWKTHKAVCRPKQNEISTQPKPAPQAPAPAIPDLTSLSQAPHLSESLVAEHKASVPDMGQVEVVEDGDAEGKGLWKRRKGEVHEDFVAADNLVKVLYEKVLLEKGHDSPDTLNVALELVEIWIGLYKLKDTDDLLMKHWEAFKKASGMLYMRAVQYLAFCRFKQFRYQECLVLFLEQRKLIGDTPELAENIGHTYNSLGLPEMAAKEFESAIKMADASGGKRTSEGSLLGLAQIKKNEHKYEEALELLFKALDNYKKQTGGAEHSLIAKTLMYIGNNYEQWGKLDKAEEYYRESMRQFVVCCGETGPLTATIWTHLAKNLLAQHKSEEAEIYFKKALQIEVTFIPLRLNPVAEMLMTLQHLATQKKAQVPKMDLEIVALGREAARQCKEQKIPEDGNLAVLYKTAAEFMCLGGQSKDAGPLLHDAIRIFDTVTEVDCTQLKAACQTIGALCKLDGFTQNQIVLPPELVESAKKGKMMD